ncbi:hypothetical protein BH09BAC5_BH09BAC5_11640 [soil metagenome]
MVIEYYKEMGVELVLTIPQDGGKTLIYKSTDETLTYVQFVYYARVYTNAFYVKENLSTPIEVGTEQEGDLYKSMGHVAMVWPDAANTEGPNQSYGYVQSSGGWPEDASKYQFPGKVQYQSQSSPPGSPARLNFLLNAPIIQPTFIPPGPVPQLKTNYTIPTQLSMPSEGEHTEEENNGSYGGPSFN